MKNTIFHPWQQFENDDTRQRQATEFFVQNHVSFPELQSECVELGKGSYGTILRIQKISVQALGLVLKCYPTMQPHVTPLTEQQRIAARIPSAPHVWGSTNSPGEKAYLCMDEIPGVNLSKLPNLSELPRSARYRIVGNGLAIVDQFQRAGTRHNDISPGNLRIDPAATLRPIDFDFAGGVHALDRNDADGTFSATPHFMPPEIIRGRGEHSDAFSMGATLITAITGQNLPQLLGVKTEFDPMQEYAIYLANRKRLKEEIGEMVRAEVRDTVVQDTLVRLLDPVPESRIVEPELRAVLEEGAMDNERFHYTLKDHSPKYAKAVEEWKERTGKPGSGETRRSLFLRQASALLENTIEFIQGAKKIWVAMGDK